MRTLGIDLGTSGVRAVVLDGIQIAEQAVTIPQADRRVPAALHQAVTDVLRRLDLAGVQAIAVDGTSGTLLATGASGVPLGALSLYSDPAPPDLAALVRQIAPAGSAAQGATSALARAIALQATRGVQRILHEADWIAGLLCQRFDTTDENNALKTGYDPIVRAWPTWLRPCGLRVDLLPRVLPPGAALAPITPEVSRRFGLPREAVVATGTTDGCASFLATGADTSGDAVTALGSTLTLKLLSDVPVSAPAFGVYSHRLWDRWLAGGASNTGGAVLAAHFTPAELVSLSARIDPTADSGLDYYPLPRAGERFPIDDPALRPRLLPRPSDDAAFLHGMLESIARIEALGYRRLAEQGAPPVRRVLTVGGGAANPVWTAIRARVLGVPVTRAADASAARGAAMLARRAVGRDSPHEMQTKTDERE
jgi:sugar (pentulose or hexulose) kinase